jgi:mannose-1-phosphate guanylyltransferase
VFRAEIEAHTAELAAALPLLERGDVEAAYGAARPVSVDVGLFERTARGAVVPGDFGWDDVGSWAALRRVRATDAAGNVWWATPTYGRAAVAWTRRTLVVYGLTNAVCPEPRITIVTADRLRHSRLLDRLPPKSGERGA